MATTTTVKTRAAVGHFFDVTAGTVSTWLAAGCPGDRGAYHLPSIVAWLRAPGGPWGPQLLKGGQSQELAFYRECRIRLAATPHPSYSPEVAAQLRAADSLTTALCDWLNTKPPAADAQIVVLDALGALQSNWLAIHESEHQ